MGNAIADITDLQVGMDFRRPEYRHEVFHRFYEFHLKYQAHPGCVYYIMPYLAQEWDGEQMLWFAYINGHTQNPVTSMIIFDEFPMLEMTDDLEDWFNTNWKLLPFDTDRRYQKKDFPAAVKWYRKLTEDKQLKFFSQFTDGVPYSNFNRLWYLVYGKFPTFGRLSAFSYLEYLRVMGLNIDCSSLFLSDMEGSRSHRNGLAIVLGKDEWDFKNGQKPVYTKDDLGFLEMEGTMLLEEALMRAAGQDWEYDVSFFTLESALCTYKSWHRPNRRYPNVYNDMLYDRIRQAEKLWPEKNFKIFWDIRNDSLPAHLLREHNPKDPGLVPAKQNHYLETGQPVMMSRDWECFDNPFDREIWKDL